MISLSVSLGDDLQYNPGGNEVVPVILSENITGAVQEKHEGVSWIR